MATNVLEESIEEVEKITTELFKFNGGKKILNHSFRVAKLIKEFAVYLDMEDHQVLKLYLSALIHHWDQKKMMAWKKDEERTEKEWREMFRRSQEAVNQAVTKLRHKDHDVLCTVRDLHRRSNGGRGPNISESVTQYIRILSLADAFDAMTNNKIRKEIKTKDEALRELNQLKNVQFSDELTKKFIDFIQSGP